MAFANDNKKYIAKIIICDQNENYVTNKNLKCVELTFT